MAGFEYHFSAEMAKTYGLDEAILIHHFAYWVKKNTIDGRNIHAGRAWTYNSQSTLSEWFGWWSRRQIQRILRSLEDKGVIIKGNYNRKPMDRTLWYTVSDAVLEHYDIQLPPAGLETMELTDRGESDAKTVQSTEPNGAMSGTEQCYEKHGTVPAIPDIIPDKKPNNTMSDHGSDGARVDQKKQFQIFWERYPRGEGKKKAEEKWKRLNPDPALFAKIMEGLERSIRSEQWRRGIIPHATTWLNGERWNDRFKDTGPDGPDPPKRIQPGEGYRYV